MHWWKKRRWLALGSGLSAATFLVVCWTVGGALVASANRPLGPPPADLAITSTTIQSESGSKLAAWYLPRESAATIILAHGIGADRRSMLNRARLFHDAGYAVLLIDLQAHGESPGQQITIGYLERHDIRAAVEYVRRLTPSNRIGIVAVSLGGAATLLASPLNIDALVLESVYPTIAEAVHNRISARLGPLSYLLTPALLYQLKPRLGITAADLRPIDRIVVVGCPVLVASGDRDRHTTLAETQRMYETALQPKRLSIFSGAAHTDLLEHDPQKYRHDVLPFLDTYLRPNEFDRGQPDEPTSAASVEKRAIAPR